MITATARTVENLATNTSITVTRIPVDYTISLGGMVSDSRVLTATAAEISQVAFFQEFQTNVPAGVTYSTDAATFISATEIRMDYTITVGGGTALGIHNFDVEYVFLDAGSVEVFRRTLNFTIEVVP